MHFASADNVRAYCVYLVYCDFRPLKTLRLCGAIFALLLALVVGFVFGTAGAADILPSVRPRIKMSFFLAFADGHVIGTVVTSVFRGCTPANVFRIFVGYEAHFLEDSFAQDGWLIGRVIDRSAVRGI